MVNIRQMLVSSSKYSLKCPYSMSPVGITIHNTYNDASANNEVSYMINNNSSTSFHYAVDDKEIVQGIPLNRNAFHASDGSGEGNRKTIAIEICYSKSGGDRFAKAEENAVDLIVYLLKKYGWGIDRVKRHYDYARDKKYCPHRTMDLGWQRFLNMVSAKLNDNGIPSINTPVTSNPTIPTTDSQYDKAKAYNSTRCKELQEKLILLGYNCGGYGADSQFGQGTYNSLVQFQKDNGLDPDGLAGIRTFAKLDELIAKKSSNSGDDWVRRLQQECNNQGFSNQKVDGIAGVNTLNGCPTLRQGASGNITKLLQEKLVSLGYSTNGIDGIYGSGTANAVKSYQSSKGLSQDGVCGQATWRKLLGL